ncbi:MAG: Transcriptional regulatory protein UhpA [Verrucomicrobiae bacterium]|nr:Transcriptional regulatory protein UhpA [Verrucomicrobiae bacterium]
MSNPRILLVDDHPVFRAGLKQILALELKQAEFGEGANAAEAMTLAPQQPWNLAILDIDMPGRSGLELLADLKALQPQLPVLLLSMHEEEDYAVRALRAGAAGYVSKESSFSEIVAAVRKVLGGGMYISPFLAEQLAKGVGTRSDGPPHLHLSNREFQILCKLAAGKPLKEIAAELGVSIKTVSTYRSRVLEKLGLQSNADLVRYALHHRLIT